MAKKPRAKPASFILHDNEPIPESDRGTWYRWMSEHKADRLVGETVLGEIEVVTEFAGFDPVTWNKPPKLFRTTVVGGKGDGMFRAYSTREQAITGHQEMVAVVKKYFSDSSK